MTSTVEVSESVPSDLSPIKTDIVLQNGGVELTPETCAPLNLSVTTLKKKKMPNSESKGAVVNGNDKPSPSEVLSVTNDVINSDSDTNIDVCSDSALSPPIVTTAIPSNGTTNGSKKSLQAGKRKSDSEQGASPIDDSSTVKKRKVNDDANSETSDANQSEFSIKSSAVKEPSDRTLAYNLFVRHVVDVTLDRSVTFCEQPRSKITAIEQACSRQFPDFTEDQHRTKIRCYLKACRRNAKKQQNRASTKEGVVVGDLCDYISPATTMVASPTPPGTPGSTAAVAVASASARARQMAAEAWEREELLIEKSRLEEEASSITSERLRSFMNPATLSDLTKSVNDVTASTSSGNGLGLPSSFSLFPFVPFNSNSNKENRTANATSTVKRNTDSDQKLGEFLQTNFWCSVEMVKAMRLSAGFILMSAQKIEDALLADPAFQTPETPVNPTSASS